MSKKEMSRMTSNFWPGRRTALPAVRSELGARVGGR